MAYGAPHIGLAGRLMVATIALVVITSATIAVLNHRSVSGEILAQSVGRLGIAGSWRGQDLEAAAAQARSDLVALARQIEIRHGGEGIPEPLDGIRRSELSALMNSTLDAKPDIARLRLMRLDGSGVTGLLTVQRESGGRLRISTPEARTVPLAAAVPGIAEIPAGVVRLGEIMVEAGPDGKMRPILPMIRRLRLAGGPELALALDFDLTAMLSLLTKRGPIGGSITVIDERGRLLLKQSEIAPNGGETLASAAYPELGKLLASRGDSIHVPAQDGREGFGAALVQQRLLDGPMVGVLTLSPDSVMLRPIANLQQTSLLGALGAGLVSIVLTIGLIRSLTRPLRRMTDAIRGMSRGESAPLPVDEGGEIGILARAHNELIATIRQKTMALEQEAEQRQKTLNLLSRHVEKASLFTALNKSSEDAIITLTPEGMISSWNPAAERLLGPRESAMVGQPIAAALPAPLADRVATVLRGPDDNTIDNLELAYPRTDGRVADIAVNLWPIRSDTGIVIGAALLARDIRARKRAEENFRLAVMASPNGMVMVDRKGTIVLANTAAENMFGYTHGDLNNQTVDMLVPSELRHTHEHHREVYTFRPETRRMGGGRELFGQRKDGTRFPVEIGLNAIHSVDGMLTLAVIVDISERRAHEQAMQDHTAELKRSNADLEQFAYVASHDLREPLRMVANYTELLAERYRGRLDERADTYIGYAVEGAKRMQQLVSDLLAYARVGTQARPSSPVESAEVIRKVLAGMQGAVMERGAAISVQPDLPIVLCDEIQLGQVFQNLIGNAIKFTPLDRKPEISISAEQDGPRWVFMVRDNGIGIEERFAERIFQMFQRLHDRGQYEGSGIGLAISKRIVERHGGKLWFKSVPGEGSEFSFQMPASKEGVVA